VNYKIILLLLSSICTISIKSTKDPKGQEFILAFLNLCKTNQPITVAAIDILMLGTYQAIADCQDVLYAPHPSSQSLKSTRDLLGNVKRLLIKHCQNKDYLCPDQKETCNEQLRQVEELFDMLQPQKKVCCLLQ